jgi:hypothetical protein
MGILCLIENSNTLSYVSFDKKNQNKQAHSTKREKGEI